MAVENSQNDGLTENDEVRRKALLRLGVAGLVTATALAGLWWLDQGSGKKPEKPVATPLPAPIVTAPLQESAPPTPAPGEATTTVEPQIPEPAGAAPGSQAATTPQPAAKTSEAPPPPKVSNAPKTLAAPTAAPRALPTQPPATQPATPAQVPATQAASGERFVVQLGVFSNPERARELVDKLKKQGIRAHMETRVQVGPFANRQEAEKAQAEMRKLGMQALVTPAAATK